jgi:hypothetical protein
MSAIRRRQNYARPSAKPGAATSLGPWGWGSDNSLLLKQAAFTIKLRNGKVIEEEEPKVVASSFKAEGEARHFPCQCPACQNARKNG